MRRVLSKFSLGEIERSKSCNFFAQISAKEFSVPHILLKRNMDDVANQIIDEFQIWISLEENPSGKSDLFSGKMFSVN
jgi:hypothetical protein